MQIVPKVNLNGTDKFTLIAVNIEVSHKARTLLESLSNATPHGRDFQLNADGDYDAARKKHSEMYHQIKEVAKYFEDLAYAIDAQ